MVELVVCDETCTVVHVIGVKCHGERGRAGQNGVTG